MRETARPVTPAPTNDNELGSFFKALSDDTRREILALLERRERNVTEIVQRFNLTQPTISRHLQVLREARLVRCERRGQHMIYRLDADTLASAAGAFFGRFSRCRGLGFGSATSAGSVSPPELTAVKRGRPHHRFRFER
ncbi:MAG: metalloregulator ArsR/SmtB family transcription factor [Thermoanaerobaculia bacterium]